MSDENIAAGPNFFELPPIQATEETKPYWVGTLPGCPRLNVSAGGISFPRYTDPPTGTDPDSMQTQRAWSKGDLVYLTEGQVNAIRESIKNKVVRFVGNRGQGFIYALGNPSFQREHSDQPLAMFLYMLPADDKAIMQRNMPRGEYPKSMYEAAGGVGKAVLPPRPRGPQADIAPEIEDLEKPAERQHVPPQLSGKKKG